ncbi:MAG: hypothetical protein K940chlam3_00006 [Chlamydiae bacterium]|nr:hypothetical protein [Chlamydiota bacterium]
MHYIIDGYNLLFRLIQSRENLEISRRSFIQDLDEKAELLKLDITVVFDGHFQEDEGTRTHYRNLEIIFSSYGESADELIVSELSSSLDVRNEVVVTSDRDLAWRAKKLHAKTESTETFYTWVLERFKKRQRKQKKESVSRKVKVPEPSPEVVGSREDTDYYLEVFEKRLKEEEKKHIPRQRKKSQEEDEVDDFKRWLRIFEKRLEE